MPANLHVSNEALVWFKGTIWPQIGAVAIIIAFGHSLLSMSGFETLAQVYREIGYPKLKNLKITGNIICVYAVVSTGIITVFAGMIIPNNIRKEYVNNLLGGLAMHLIQDAVSLASALNQTAPRRRRHERELVAEGAAQDRAFGGGPDGPDDEGGDRLIARPQAAAQHGGRIDWKRPICATPDSGETWRAK